MELVGLVLPLFFFFFLQLSSLHVDTNMETDDGRV